MKSGEAGTSGPCPLLVSQSAEARPGLDPSPQGWVLGLLALATLRSSCGWNAEWRVFLVSLVVSTWKKKTAEEPW